jgi:hypothetical protein
LRKVAGLQAVVTEACASWFLIFDGVIVRGPG